MERPQADQPRDDADADDRQTPEQFADELESDPAHNPSIDELRDLKSG
ncbi:MAG TPA: hypothetical protein VM299_02185 [Solirubrobacteraceae bacterium]|jgi:hypothetical protein|nr:hypothetical protein [Solirubrobacteraceae bacterium]